MKRQRPLPNPDDYDEGVADGIKMYMAHFINAFYGDKVSAEDVRILGMGLSLKFVEEGWDSEKIPDKLFSYRLFEEIIKSFGPPELQPPPDFKQFETEKAPKKPQKRKPVKHKPSNGS